MIKLPNYILVVECRYSILNEGVLEILKEYFSGMPYLQYTSPSLYDSKDTYYILPYTNTFRAIVSEIVEKICVEIIDNFGYAVYKNCGCNLIFYDKCSDKEALNYRWFPQILRNLTSSDIPKLHSLQD